MWTSVLRLKSFGMPNSSAFDAHVAHRRLRRLLHDVAELAGERQVALARHQRRFGHEDLAADFGPGQAGRDADLVRLLGHRVAEARHAEVLR